MRALPRRSPCSGPHEAALGVCPGPGPHLEGGAHLACGHSCQQLHLLLATDSGQPAPQQQGRQQAPRAGLHAGQSPAPPGIHRSDSPSPWPYHRSCPHSRRGDRVRPSAPTAASWGHLQVRAPHRQRGPLPPLRGKHLEDDQEVTHVDITHSGPATGNYPNHTGESSNIL